MVLDISFLQIKTRFFVHNKEVTKTFFLKKNFFFQTFKTIDFINNVLMWIVFCSQVHQEGENLFSSIWLQREVQLAHQKELSAIIQYHYDRNCLTESKNSEAFWFKGTKLEKIYHTILSIGTQVLLRRKFGRFFKILLSSQKTLTYTQPN